MSATDELRRMLDERGVEYVPNMFGITWGYYSDAHTAAESMEGTLIVTGLTPEQAIAATLGVGTCTIGDYKDPDYGYTHDAMWNDEWFVPSGRCSGCGEYIPVWNYCPNCGRKVEG